VEIRLKFRKKNEQSNAQYANNLHLTVGFHSTQIKNISTQIKNISTQNICKTFSFPTRLLTVA